MGVLGEVCGGRARPVGGLEWVMGTVRGGRVCTACGLVGLRHAVLYGAGLGWRCPTGRSVGAALTTPRGLVP